MCDDSIQDALSSLQYEVANLRSRITCVEEENQNLRNQIHTMEKIVHEYNDDDCAPHRKRRNSSYGGMTRSSSGNKGGRYQHRIQKPVTFAILGDVEHARIE